MTQNATLNLKRRFQVFVFFINAKPEEPTLLFVCFIIIYLSLPYLFVSSSRGQHLLKYSSLCVYLKVCLSEVCKYPCREVKLTQYKLCL